MGNLELFADLGFFLEHRFLCADLLRDVVGEMTAAQHRGDVVFAADGSPTYDERARRSRRVDVSETCREILVSRLVALRPRLERHFGLTLSGIQGPEFHRWRTGDHFALHRDGAPDAEARFLRDRKISVVVFLNGAPDSAGDAGYSGGTLTFYDLFESSRPGPLGLALRGDAGLLVAFGSDVAHAVTPVTGGERFTTVCWFV